MTKKDPYSAIDQHRKAFIEQNLSVLQDAKPESAKAQLLEEAYVAHRAAAQEEDEQRKAALSDDEANLLRLYDEASE